MKGRSNQNQLISMDEYHGQTVVIDGKGNNAEIHRIVDNGLEHSSVIGALDVDRHFWVLLLELGEDVRQDVKARAFVRADDDLTARNALHFSDRDHHGFTGIQSFLHVLEEGLARCRQRDLPAGAVKEFSPYFFLDATDLGGDGRLGAETLLCGTGERGVPRDFQKGFELVEVHRTSG